MKQTRILQVKSSRVDKQPYADFVSILHPKTMQELNLEDGNYIILEKQNSPNKIRSPVLSSNHKWVRVELTEDEICLDQTYRNALNVEIDKKIYIRPTCDKVSWKNKKPPIGNYQNALVVIQENPTYKEQKVPVICVSKEIMNVINAEYGDEVIMETIDIIDAGRICDTVQITDHRVKCFPLTAAMQKCHDKLHSLESKNPIYLAFADSTIRKSLNLKPGNPVKIRRTFRWEVKKKLKDLGKLSLAPLAVTLIPPIVNQNLTYSLILTGIFAGWFIWSVITSSSKIDP